MGGGKHSDASRWQVRSAFYFYLLAVDLDMQLGQGVVYSIDDFGGLHVFKWLLPFLCPNNYLNWLEGIDGLVRWWWWWSLRRSDG